MKIFKVEDFHRGWLVGDFSPSIIRTKEFEFMLRSYKKGDKESGHVHNIAHEITAIVSGQAKMNTHILIAGDVMHLEPGDASDFECLEDCTTAVIKFPSVPEDKYLV